MDEERISNVCRFQSYELLADSHDRAALKYLSGLCSPVSRISRIRSRYWYSSWFADSLRATLTSVFVGISATGCVSKIEGAMMSVDSVEVCCCQISKFTRRVILERRD